MTGRAGAAMERNVVTVFDVAQHAGVSAATVSRVLLGRAIVAAETRARVLRSVEKLGYRPNPLAQGLRMGRGHVVALLVGDIEQGVYSSLTKHMQAALESIGLELMLFNLGHSEERLRALLRRASALRLRGIAIASSDVIGVGELMPAIRALADDGIPVISIWQRLDRHGIPSVVHDDAAAARKAVSYLIEKGRAPIAYLGRIRVSAAGRERYKGYKLALDHAGIALRPELVWESENRYRYEAGYEAMSEALERGVKPGAVFAASDELALGAMAAALDRGLRVPDDMAFVGFGGAAWSAHARPSLTTVGGDPRAISDGVRAVFQALEESADIAMRTVIERTLIFRQSA